MRAVEGIEFELLPSSALVRGRGRIPRNVIYSDEPAFHRKRAARNISMQWTEKIWIAVDQLQLFALLWLTECADTDRRFPFVWCTNTMWSPYVNADLNAIWSFEFNALNSSVSLNDDPNKWIVYDDSKLWVLFSAPSVIILVYIVYIFLFQRKLKQILGLHAWTVPVLERSVLFILYYAYLPWQLIISRYTLCVEMQASQNWQLLYTCANLTSFQQMCRERKNCALSNAANDQSTFITACTLVIFFSLGLPILFWFHIRRGLVLTGWRHHERWLRAIETEYMFEASGYWSHHHYPLHSSVYQPWAVLLPFSLIEKLIIAWILAAFNPIPNGLVIRDFLVLIILSLHLAALCGWPSFRLNSSRLMAQVLLGGNIVTAAVRALISAGFTSNVFLLLGLLLPAHHALAVLMSFAAIVYCIASGERWPVNAASVNALDTAVLRMTVAGSWSGDWAEEEDGAASHPTLQGVDGQGVRAPAPWAAAEAGVRDLAAAPRLTSGAASRWDGVCGLLEGARAALLEEQLRTDGFFRVGLTRCRIVMLERLLAAARRAGHGLEYAVEDVLYDTVAAHNAAAAVFRRAYPLCRWDSFADHPRLGPLLPAWRAALDHRDHVLLLLPRRTRRLLTRLAALRAFVALRIQVAHTRSVRRRARLDAAPSPRRDRGGGGGDGGGGGGTAGGGAGRRRRGEKEP
jgi:hypothetical protein